MHQKEALLLVGLVAAALTAAFAFRVVSVPGDLHDPAFAARFSEACDVFPILRAVRVRTTESDADLLARLRGAGRVVSSRRAERELSHGRLLFGTAAEVRAVRDALRENRRPASLPDVPAIRDHFSDRRGPFACDVILADDEHVDRVRKALPDAVLSGEPVRLEHERGESKEVPRALLIALALAYAWRRLRGARSESSQSGERDLLAAVLPLAILGLLGWGIDVWTVPALALAVAAPRGRILVSGVFCLLFPAQALRRIGLVLVVAGVVRWTRARGRETGDRASAIRGMALAWLIAAAFVAAWPVRSPEPVEEAVAFVPLDGIDNPVPPDADRPTRVMLNEIYRRADVLGFVEVRDAAAVDSLYWPRDLRARLRTEDGRGARWVSEPSLDREQLESSELYRLRGDRGMRHDARVAALLMLLACGVAMVVQRSAPRALLMRCAAIAVGVPLCPDAAYPLLVVAAFVPSWAVVFSIAGAALAMPEILWRPAVTLGLASAVAWFSRRRPHRPYPLPVPQAGTGPGLPGR